MKSHRTSIGGAVSAALLGIALAHAQAPSADTLLDRAKREAAANQRAILVIFQASW
jgi:hypothetical protein